ncbi:MAG: hypothetical protein PHH58_00085 [Rhodoferax sp.]|nr:hypothetical protein [Rhodoferax sp.]
MIGSGLFASPWALSQQAATPDGAGSAPTAAAPVAAALPEAPAVPSAELIQQGKNLFLGTQRLSAGGPACNACHNVLNDAVPGGGTLAKDLTKTFTRIGADGIQEKLPLADEESPFPVMQRAYQGRQLIAAEGQALGAFLQHADAQAATQKANNMGTNMLLAGFGGVVFLLVLFSMLGSKRKRRSVNSELFDRQISTT